MCDCAEARSRFQQKVLWETREVGRLSATSCSTGPPGQLLYRSLVPGPWPLLLHLPLMILSSLSPSQPAGKEGWNVPWDNKNK